jgi:hypothetical protein
MHVVGNVLRPGPIPLGRTVTVSKAIAMVVRHADKAGPDTDCATRFEHRRQEEIVIDLKAIRLRQAPDVAILPNDIIDVPVSGSKRFLRSRWRHRAGSDPAPRARYSLVLWGD